MPSISYCTRPHVFTSFPRLKNKFNQLEFFFQSLANDDAKVNKTQRISAEIGYYFSSALRPRLRSSSFGAGPRPHLLFHGSQPKLLFCGPRVSILLFHGPESSKLLFDGRVGRKHFLYFCIVKVSNFSIILFNCSIVLFRVGNL